MTPQPIIRRQPRTRRVVLGLTLLIAAPAALAGCDPRQALFFLQPFEPKIAAPFAPAKMKGKRVVVLATAAPGTTNEYAGIDRDIANELVKTLRKEIKKIDVVDPAKVREWAAGKRTLTDPADAARAFEADIVIFLEIQKFQVQNPIDLAMYQGKSNIRIQVTELSYPKDDRGKEMKDKPKESEVVYEGDRDTEFPITGGISIDAGTSKSVFKNRFMKVVNDQISWHFVDHPPGDNIQDTNFSR